MANGMFSGIVQTPEQVQTARRRTMFEQARSAASLTPEQQALMLARESGQNTGSLIAGLFGVEDPELKKARDFQNAAMSIKERLTPEQQANPALVYGEMAKAAVDLGYVSEGLRFAEEAQKFRSISQKVSSEAITTKGIRVFRRGDGPLLAEEDGQDVPYDPKKHGRFETAQDRVRDRPSFSYKTDRMGNTQVYQDGQLIRTDPAPWMQGGPAAPTPGKSNVRTLEDLRKSLAGQK